MFKDPLFSRIGRDPTPSTPEFGSGDIGRLKPCVAKKDYLQAVRNRHVRSSGEPLSTPIWWLLTAVRQQKNVHDRLHADARSPHGQL